MPSSDDLPTPEPAKMPRRWPRPHGMTPSSARTPSVTRSSMRGRLSGSGGEPSVERSFAPSAWGMPSIGRPRPSRTRPSSSSPTWTRIASPVAVTVRPGAMPLMSPSGMSSVWPPRKPTTSAGTSGRRRPGGIMQTSPTSASRPVASTVRPMRAETRPWRRGRSAWRRPAVAPPRMPAPPAPPSAPRRRWPPAGRGSRARGGRRSRRHALQLGDDDLARALELGVEAGVDLRGGGADDRAAAADAPLLLDLDVVDPAELGGEPVDRLADDPEVFGVDEELHALAFHEAAQGAAHDVEHGLGPRFDGAGDDLARELERELDGAGLDAVGEIGPLRRQRGDRGMDSLDGRGELGDGLLAADLGPLGPAEGEALGARLLADGVGLRAGGLDDGEEVADGGRGGGGLELIEDERLGGHQSIWSSSPPPPRAMTISPDSSRRRITPTMRPCASSTTLRFWAGWNSISSRSISAPRSDMFLKIRSLVSSLTPRSASARSLASTSLSTIWMLRSSSLTMSSKVNRSIRTSSASSE